MPGYIDIAIVGDAAGVQAMLMHLEQKLLPPNLGVFLTAQVEPFLRTRAGARFASEGDDVVGKWKPLSVQTQQIRASQGYGAEHPINRRTGELEDYIANSRGSVVIHPAGSTLIYPGTPASGQLLDKVETAQQGDTRTFPRPVLGMNERDLAAVLTMMALEIQRP